MRKVCSTTGQNTAFLLCIALTHEKACKKLVIAQETLGDEEHQHKVAKKEKGITDIMWTKVIILINVITVISNAKVRWQVCSKDPIYPKLLE
ncbi:uncharacterized protein LOC136081653 isoform X3 [Hydra vulgaris]|uniref:Uncharacterized protein LOC136081653 isoform X3 n=1 Tax=Hydra vulgaris TaxID=6087 RepID=A0ABM4C1B0_HYDVU